MKTYFFKSKTELYYATQTSLDSETPSKIARYYFRFLTVAVLVKAINLTSI